MDNKQYTMEQYELLCNAYNNAVILEQEQFEFGDRILLTDYAKYLLDHMASVLEPELKRG
jgi:hypothetical protein